MSNGNVAGRIGNQGTPNMPSGGNGGHGYLLEKINAVEKEVAVINEKLLNMPTKDDLTDAVTAVRNEINMRWMTWIGLSVGAITMVAAIIAAANSVI